MGRTVAEAFYYMYYLNKACEIQVNLLATGAKLSIPSPEICEYVARQYEDPVCDTEIVATWEANCRLLDRLDPSYRR